MTRERERKKHVDVWRNYSCNLSRVLQANQAAIKGGSLGLERDVPLDSSVAINVCLFPCSVISCVGTEFLSLLRQPEPLDRPSALIASEASEKQEIRKKGLAK